MCVDVVLVSCVFPMLSYWFPIDFVCFLMISDCLHMFPYALSLVSFWFFKFFYDSYWFSIHVLCSYGFLLIVCDSLWLRLISYPAIWFRVSLKKKGYRCCEIHIILYVFGIAGSLHNYNSTIFATKTITESIKMITISFNKHCKGTLVDRNRTPT